MPDPIDESPYLTTEEAAAYLRMSRFTLEKFRSQGGGPNFRHHGGVVYTKVDLDAWSNARKRAQTDRKTRSTGDGQ